MIGTNAGGGDDPNVQMSLSNTSAYFFGVKQPLVPVGAIQMFAGSVVPNGYLLCQGKIISKTTYNLQWVVIRNIYLNGRVSSSTNFHLPDLRGVFIRGAGLSTAYSPNVTGESLREFQSHSVQNHINNHARPTNSISVSSGGGVSTSSDWNNGETISKTVGGVYDENDDALEAEARRLDYF